MSSRTLEPSAHRRKRVRFSADDSSEPSISDSSALVATSVAEESTDASNFDSDSENEVSDSSEEPSSDSESEDDDADDAESDVDMQGDDDGDGVTNLRANRGKKPVMKVNTEELGPDIRTFLKDFMPQLKAANEELEVQRKAGTLDSRKIEADEEDDAKQYIEMVSSSVY